MTGFPTAARRVRDPRLSLGGRLRNLRVCVQNFDPYGFRATWHHIVASAAIPKRLEDDPGSLLRAVEELREARDFFIGAREALTAQRKREKAAGQRAPDEADRWQLVGIHGLAYCPDPALHPTGRLKEVLSLLVEAYTSSADGSGRCPLCRTPRRTQPCPGCGVELHAHLALESLSPRLDRRQQALPFRFRDGRLAALRLGRRLVAEVPGARPGRRAFVDIVPARTDADRAADREGWSRRDTQRAFVVRHWDYDDHAGAELIRTERAPDEPSLLALLHNWGLHPDGFDYPWRTADPI